MYLRHELADHCRTSKPDKLRFQDGRLIDNLWERVQIAAGSDPLEQIVKMLRCYRFITTIQLGYDEPQRLHCEEMKAVELQDSPRSFCLSWSRRFAKNQLTTNQEFWFRVNSISSWVEAQESFSTWLAFRNNRPFWQGVDRHATVRAFQTWILATLNTHLVKYEFKGRKVRGAKLWQAMGVGANADGSPWNSRQWANILEQAARLAKKRHDNYTPLEYLGVVVLPNFFSLWLNARSK